MKKVLKWIGVSIAALVFLLIILATITVWIVFTPEKLTPIVRKQANNYLTCKTDIESVELTFFSTFPLLGLKVNNLALINPVPGAPNDTFAKMENLIGIVDVAAWWKRDEIVLNEFIAYNGAIHAFSDTLGNSNYNILNPDKDAAAEDTSGFSGAMDLKNIELENISLSYIDLKEKINAGIQNLSARFSGSMKSDSVEAHILIDESKVSFSLGKDVFLNENVVVIDMPVKVNLNNQTIRLENANFSIGNLDFTVNGTIENDTINKKLHTNLSYQLSSWTITELLAMVPEKFKKNLKGMDIKGIVASKGTIIGSYTDSVMPMMNLSIQLQDMEFRYDSFPLPVKNINGDFIFYSDLKNDSLSYLKINHFSARTPKSFFKTKGTIKNLFSDVYIDLESTANLASDELNDFIPDSLNTKLNGKIDAQIKSRLRLSQIDKTQYDKMNLSGYIKLSNFEAQYDTIKLFSESTGIRFSLPNQKSTSDRKFLNAQIQTTRLESNISDKYFLKIPDASLRLETSNLMDSTKFPRILLSYNISSLWIESDTINLAVNNPSGTLDMAPQQENDTLPGFLVNYKSSRIKSSFGKNELFIDTINLKANIIKNPNLKDTLFQWLGNGFLDLNNGMVKVVQLPHSVEIPAIKFDFDHDNFTIRESKLKIDQTDFSLSGKLSNVLSYFRKDSLLKGDFSFSSRYTDLLQLMVLTNGLGDTATNATATAEQTEEVTGPYFVPKGIDFILRTNVGKASFGYDTISNIQGNVRLKDGLLVLEDLILDSKAAKIELTAMYRTPRKNHLFLGIDYHMLDVDIANLLKIIPDIDSMMPMLRDFKGNAEFHFAAETYLDSMYNMKMSTIRGTSSIRGKDLVLLDGPSFDELSKILRFNKKTENKIDSLSVEFTIFKNEIDIYPFLIAMDKYKAIVSGRHNLDMSFDYHVSLVESPLPIKLGANIEGTIDDLKFRPAKRKYDLQYRPTARNVVQNKQLQIRKMIRDALVEKMKIHSDENEAKQ